MLEQLNAIAQERSGIGFTFQSVLTKYGAGFADGAPHPRIPQIEAKINLHAPLCLPPIITQAKDRPMVGIHQLRECILEVCGVAR